MYPFEKIVPVLNPIKTITRRQNCIIQFLLTDSRRIIFPQESLFFGLVTPKNNGHFYIEDAYSKGVRNFVISENIDAEKYPKANFLIVRNTLQALQQLACFHRQQFDFPVLGITGSNGKTIVKEWLNLVLENDFRIVRSPRSYNSQIGVALSIWNIQQENNLGIFEAGISTKNEMIHLEKMIQPTIGILTNLRAAHNEGFKNETEKLNEKLILLANCSVVILPFHCAAQLQDKKNQKKYTFSFEDKNAFLYVEKLEKKDGCSQLLLCLNEEKIVLQVPFTDEASIENCLCVFLTLYHFKYSLEMIQKKLNLLYPIEMRMQLVKGDNGCTILNDVYSNDLASFQIALDYFQQQAQQNKQTIILSEIIESGIPKKQIIERLITALKQYPIARFIGIGTSFLQYAGLFKNLSFQTFFFENTNAFLKDFLKFPFRNEGILVKGARQFLFEKIIEKLEKNTHGTVLEINLSALVFNLNQIKTCLHPSTKIMMMVKAFGYGSGNIEIAKILQYHHTDYLAVAYVEEAIPLRENGIQLPIMVMNCVDSNFNLLIAYNLEPEIYSIHFYQAFNRYLKKQGITNYPCHLKINTGMNRLGLDTEEAMIIAEQLLTNKTVYIQSIFSHLSSSDLEKHDKYSQEQFDLFVETAHQIENIIGYKCILHIANSAAILRLPTMQLDMVRLGIGLYGIAPTNALKLENVLQLKTTITQIRKVKQTDTIGYNKSGILTKETPIGIIRIGYADGLNRLLGNRNGYVYIDGKHAPIIGNICMDMTMIDLTEIPTAKEGDEVEIFGKYIPIETIAEKCQTIPYEIMTSISARVRRIYIEE